MLGVNGLIDSARLLTSVGVDVNELITLALKNVNQQLNGAAYEITDLDALLQEAQAMGDEVVKTPQGETGHVTPTTEVDDSSKGDFRESD
jgi:hypothetical protein